MSSVSIANVEQDVAQALLDLQSNVRETATGQCKVNSLSDSVEDMESTANFFLSCFITSQLQTSPKIAMANQDPLNETCGSKRSEIFKQKPTKLCNISHTSANRAKTDKHNRKVSTRDMGTQTEDKYQLPMIETMEFTIERLCAKIKSLEDQIKTNTKLLQSTDQNNFDGNDDVENDDASYETKSYSNDDTMMNDSEDISDNYMSTPFVKANTSHESKSDKVLFNRNSKANTDDMVPLGDGNALIPSRIFRHINWNSYTSATRKLLTAVFSRKVLATHSLTGKPSPAFPNKPAKKKLDSALVNDIVQTVVDRCCVPENVVRTSITTKCADESKMFRTRQQNKKRRKCNLNRENIPPESDSD